MDTLSLHAQDGNPTKVCSKCKRELPAISEYFRRDASKKDGFRPNCKQCKFYAPKQPNDLPEGQKRYSKCQKVYPATLEYFHREKGHTDGLTSHCSQCRTETTTNYNSRNREQRLAYKVSFRRIHRTELLEKQKLYYRKHPEEIRIRRINYAAKNREHLRELQAKYFQTERGKIAQRLGAQKRRARKRNVPGTLTYQQIQDKLKAQKYRCYYAACGHAKFEQVNGKYIYHLEHTIPISRDGFDPRHDVNYVVLACPSCNLSKRDKLPHEWPEGGRLL